MVMSGESRVISGKELPVVLSRCIAALVVFSMRIPSVLLMACVSVIVARLVFSSSMPMLKLVIVHDVIVMFSFQPAFIPIPLLFPVIVIPCPSAVQSMLMLSAPISMPFVPWQDSGCIIVALRVMLLVQFAICLLAIISVLFAFSSMSVVLMIVLL